MAKKSMSSDNVNSTMDSAMSASKGLPAKQIEKLSPQEAADL